MTVGLRAVPAGALARVYLVHRAGTETRLAFRGWRQRASVVLDGETYRFGPEGWRGRLVLERERDGYVMARAERVGFWSGKQALTLSDRRLELEPRGWLRRTWAITHGGRDLGWIKSTGFLDRVYEASLDDRLPLPIQLFVLYVVIVLKRRQAAAAAAAG